MTTFGDAVYQFGGVPAANYHFTRVIHCKPSTGLDGNDGLSIKTPVKTLEKAHSLLNADKNEAVFMYSEDNSASGTTDYQSSTLVWSKDGTSLVGINQSGFMGHRSRIAQLSTATSVSPLVQVTASNFSMHNIHIFHGVDDAGSTIALEVTGERNLFENCHIAGIGNSTQDVSAARSLLLTGAAETLFKDCTIGLDTVSRGTASSEIEFASQVTRVAFEGCYFPTFAGDAGFTFLDASATSSLDRFISFRNCSFINAVESTATEMTEAVDTASDAGGMILIQNCAIVGVGAAGYDSGGVGNVYNSTPTSGANGDGGIAEPVD